MRHEVRMSQGAARYTDDLPLPPGTLHAMVATSPHAHARFSQVFIDEALAIAGVVAVFTAQDIPGINDIGHIHHDEPLLADGVVHCVGHPYAIVVATDHHVARRAAGKVGADFEVLPAVLDVLTAWRSGALIQPPRTLAAGDVDAAFERCATVVEGTAATGSAEHLYLETQCTLCVPRDDGGLHVYAATQSPGMVQKGVAAITALPMHRVVVEVARLGGGFGGKEDHATPWACCAALAAHLLRQPVKIRLERNEDLRLTGKRHPYVAEYRLGLDAEGRIQAWDVLMLQNAGATCDISPIVLERSLLHAGNAYRIPNLRVTLGSCRTNLPTNTAFRGFGAPQAIFVLESALRAAARKLKIPARDLQARNLLSTEDSMSYGMPANTARIREAWENMDRCFEPEVRAAEAAAFNAQHRWRKKAIDLLPVCFGVGFTSKHLNQAEALLHVYVDGSVAVTTGAVEMGQGVYAKIRRIVANTLGIDAASVSVESTSTARVANISPTAASTGADLNGAAAKQACRTLLRGLRDAGLLDDMAWRARIAAAYEQRVPLSVLAHYAAPGLSFDRAAVQGTPFLYHVCGVALVESELDVLRGTGRINRVSVVHDAGNSLDEAIDHGQIAGALVQGIGWMTCEELVHDADGRLMQDTMARYHIPGMADAPEIDIVLLPSLEEDRRTPIGAKAVGEPPLVYGLGAYFALRAALDAARGDLRALTDDDDTAPLTAKRLLDCLHGSPLKRRVGLH